MTEEICETCGHKKIRLRGGRYICVKYECYFKEKE